MRNREEKKVPGFSFIEVGGVIHKFVNGDQTHSNWREIYRKLDEISFKITSVFAHGKEQVRSSPGHSINKNTKTEEQLRKSWTSRTYGTKSHFPFNHTASASAPPSQPPQQGMKKSTMKFKQENSSTAGDWSPEDDGIEIKIPSSIEKPAAKETVDSCINAILYGPSRRRRLPVFEKICPSEE
ncbi:hypothetical protein NE237_027118 [Protea cynaroides]|uniref:Uncharacterized protein n=1 Tax=Protea cynaroides TaxID=273540 RepID=A0A9Q0GLY5_9MAGN|nr:hypothetical protein NE237_027118 [Protea cynaroides]